MSVKIFLASVLSFLICCITFLSSCLKEDPTKLIVKDSIIYKTKDSIVYKTKDSLVVDVKDSLIYIQPDSINNIAIGLIGYYLFSGNAADSSGAHNDATNLGATLVTDRKGINNHALFFDGTGYVDLPAAAFKNNTYTYSAWVNIATLPGNGEVACPLSIGQQDDSDPDGHPHQAISIANLYGSAQAVGFNAGGYNIGDPRTTSAETNVLPSANVWYHVVSVRSSSEIALYINGKIVGASLTNLTLPDYGTSTAARIGIRANLTDPFFGIIDDVRIYNRALSDKEVSTIYWTSRAE